MVDDDTKNEKLQASGLVDWSVFSELIAIMDEDEDGLALSLFQDFVTQFEETVGELDTNIEAGNLDTLSSLGHYIKGSAAALGLVTLSHQCERIQNYGHRNNFDRCLIGEDGKVIENDDDDDAGDAAPDKDDKPITSDKDFLVLVQDATEKAKTAFKKSRVVLSEYFGEEL
ncbi:phosphorelay intermediate protein Ypd1p [Diutina catenulata]